jgi:hypothetical protein
LLLLEVTMNRRGFVIGAGGLLLTAAAGGAAWKAFTGSMEDYEAYAARLRASLAPAGMAELIRYATLAANSHNTQPWLFRLGSNAVDILPDVSRRTPAVDPDDHHLFVTLGCAAENLAIAAAATGRPGETVISAEGVRYKFSAGPVQQSPLVEAIQKRQSTRGAYDGRAVPAQDLARLERAGAAPGVRLILVTDRAKMAAIRDLVTAGNSDQLADQAFVRELKQWLRFNPQSAMARGDGLFSASSGNPSVPSFFGEHVFDLVFKAEGENAKYARHIDTSAGIAVFLGDREDKEHWIKVGIACQRFALTATSLGLKHAFINQPVEVARLRGELAGLAGEAGKRPDIVMRFGYGPALPYSPRRPVAAVLV